MFSPKTALIGAIAGFAVSCIAGIIGSVSFGIVLLRAVLSAVFSALLIGGVHFVYARFLADAQGDDTNFAVKATPAGSTVDITLDDADLPDTDNAPDFFVEKGDGILGEQSSREASAADRAGSFANTAAQPAQNTAAYTAEAAVQSSVTTQSHGAVQNSSASYSAETAAFSHAQNTDALQNNAPHGTAETLAMQNAADSAASQSGALQSEAAQNEAGADTDTAAVKTGHSLRVNSADIADSAETLANEAGFGAEEYGAQASAQTESSSALGTADAQIEALPSLDGFSSDALGAPPADGETFSAESGIASGALGQDSIFSEPGELKKTGLSENLTDFGNTEDIAAAVRTVLKKES